MAKRALGLDLEKFGEFVRAQRQLAGYSLRQLADLTDVSNAYLSQLEHGKHEPSVRVIRSVAEALNVSAETMLDYLGFGDLDDERGPGSPGATEAAIAADPDLSPEQRVALLSVYRSYTAD